MRFEEAACAEPFLTKEELGQFCEFFRAFIGNVRVIFVRLIIFYEKTSAEAVPNILLFVRFILLDSRMGGQKVSRTSP
jgi:hypothetical protein